MHRHDVPEHEIDGACANLHKLATGEWPGRNAHKHHLATAAVISLTAAMGAYDPIRWEGPLARIESPTGDRRQFPRDTLTYQSFPQPLRWQKQGMAGHNGAVTVGVIKAADERDVDAAAAAGYGIEPGRYVWGHGYFLDPNVFGEVNEAVHQVEHGVSGPSVDLDSFTAVISKTLAGETVANMKRGRQRAATLVSVPAFADLRIKITRPDTAKVASGATFEAPDAAFAVNSTGWHGSPIAPREALFNADHAAKRIEGWANGDPAKMAKMFLWVDTANGPLLGRTGYRLPWGDIVDGKPYLIFHAVYAAAALLEGGHGGLPHIPDDEKNKLRTVVSSIYEQMAREFDDASIMAPWDRRRDQAQQQASGQPEPEEEDDESEYQETEEYATYLASYDAALTGFGHHRYKERLHPRDPRRNDHAGEWVDVPKHDAHGRIKVGSKWVYPPKKGEKGYSNPQASVRAKAKRGAGTKVAHKAEKPSPDKGSRPHAAPSSAPSAPAAKKVPAGKPVAKLEAERETLRGKLGRAEDRRKARKEQVPGSEETDIHEQLRQKDIEVHRARGQHVEALRQMGTPEQRAYLHGLDDDEIDTLLKRVGGKRLDDDKRDDLETEILHKVKKDEGADAGEAERKKDQERAKGLREISHKDGSKTIVAKKKAPESEDDETKAAQTKVAEKKAPAKKTATKVVAKKTGKAKEHKLTEPQERALKTLRFDEDSRIHPATRKVLTREGFLDENGKLTDKGRGGEKVLEKKDSEKIDAKVPEKKAPEKKAVAKKTTVAKKTPVAKLTPAQHKEKLGQIESRDEAKTYLAGVKGKDLTDLETELGMGHSGTVGDRRERIAERTVGSRLNSEAVRGGKKDSGTKTAEAKTPEKKAAAGGADEARAARVKEHVEFFRTSMDRTAVDNRLETIKSKEELVQIIQGLDKEYQFDGRYTVEHLRNVVRHQSDAIIWRETQRRRQENKESLASLRQEHHAEISKIPVKAFPDGTGSNPAKLSDEFLHHHARPWEVIPHDTGPQGIPVENLSVSDAHPWLGIEAYKMGQGRAFRFDGVVYIVEADSSKSSEAEMAQRLHRFRQSLPPSAAKHQRAFVFVKGTSPADKYWQKEYNSSDHRAVASAGNGQTTVWAGGWSRGRVPDDEELFGVLRHEFGHNVGKSRDAQNLDINDESAEWARMARKDYTVDQAARFSGVEWSLPPGSHGVSLVHQDGRAFPTGVSAYGKSSPAEDYAESTALYLHGPIGVIRRDGKSHPVFFRDVFPGRAKLLDQLFPDVSAVQKKLIDRRGAI